MEALRVCWGFHRTAWCPVFRTYVLIYMFTTFRTLLVALFNFHLQLELPALFQDELNIFDCSVCLNSFSFIKALKVRYMVSQQIFVPNTFFPLSPPLDQMTVSGFDRVIASPGCSPVSISWSVETRPNWDKLSSSFSNPTCFTFS